MSVPLRAVMVKSYAQGLTQLVAQGDAKMLDTVTVTRRGTPTFSYSTLLTTDTPTTIYSGMAKCSVVTGGSPIVIGDSTEYWDSLTVELPNAAAMCFIDDTVVITSAVDPDIVGKKFRVTSVENGGLMPASQTLSCMGVAPSRTNPSA